MKRLLLALLLLAAPASFAQTYTTSFPTVQNPISEGGNWINANGIAGFTNVQVGSANHAIGTQTSGAGFTDSTAVLTGSWGVNQTVQATYHTTNNIEENELRVLTTIAAGGITGYELNCTGGYVEIVRWDGGIPLAFTILTHDTGHHCNDGNVIKATTDNSGNIRFFINGVQTNAVIDTTYKTGSPGIGFNTFINSGGVNSDHWLSDFSATATGGSAVTATLLPSSLGFGSQNVGTPSVGQNLTLTNTSTGGNNLTGIVVSVTGANFGDFSQTNTCTGTLTPGNNCTITVKFTPSLTGSRTASISVADNATGSPQISNLSGTGAGGGGGTMPWSAILSPSRAIDWSGAGLPTSYPNGETTPNPWTPPTGRTQCGATIAGGATATAINAAIAACPAGTFVLLGGTIASPATFTVNNEQLRLTDTPGGASHNGTTLRGSGPMATKIVLTGSAFIAMGNAWTAGSAPWTAGFAQGSTSLTMGTPTSGSIFSAGQLIGLTQCQSGFGGAGCTGAVADNGGLFLCGGSTACANQAGNNDLQSQTVRVTSITGTGPFTVNFTPALYMPNWSVNGGGAKVNWTKASGNSSADSPYGIGLENVTVDMTAVTANFGIQMGYVYGSWIKGVRIVGAAASKAVLMTGTKNSLIANTMFDNYSYAIGPLSLSLQVAADSDNLIINNIMLHGLSYEGLGSNEGDIIAYNLIAQTHTLYYEANPFQHTPGNAFTLYEGNQTGHITDDDTWGSANLNAFVRNYLSGVDPPYLLATSCASLSCVAMKVDGVHRFSNIIGNAIGSSLITNYQAILSTPTNGITNNAAYRWSADTNDPLTLSSSLRWGNCDTSSTLPSCKFSSSEVPTGLTGNAAPFNNNASGGPGVPATQNLPCTFFLKGYNTSTSCTPPTGTGFSWWKVCTVWTTFPTSCTSTQTPPFPAAGPDVNGGPYVGGHAFDIPAAIAFNTLPVDPAYQLSWAITGSSWSGGTETLTIPSLPAGSAHIMGGFNLTGTDARCIPSGTGVEITMTGSTATTVKYALPVNPTVACTGTMKWPNVKQFDDRVFQLDSGGPAVPNAPTNLTATVAGSNVNLAWTLPSGTLTNIKVYRSTVHGGPYSLLATLVGTATSMTDTPPPATTFFYVVTASNSAGESARSNEASATIGGAITATLAPASLTFASQLVGTPSVGQNVTLTNTSGAGVNLAIGTISFGGTNPGDFSQTNTCPGVLASGGFCTITVKFLPTAAGTRLASLQVADNSTTTPHTTTLTGTGTAGVPSITLTPSSLNFGNQTVSTTSTVRSIVLANSGTATLTITSITLTGTNAGDFGISDTCGGSVVPSGTCNINLTFTPSAAGVRTASAQVLDNAAGSPHNAALQGTGITVKCALTGNTLESGITIVCGP